MHPTTRLAFLVMPRKSQTAHHMRYGALRPRLPIRASRIALDSASGPHSGGAVVPVRVSEALVSMVSAPSDNNLEVPRRIVMLLVHEESLFRDLMAEIVADLGLDTVLCPDPDDALSRAQQLRPALLLADVDFLDDSGVDIADALCGPATALHIPALVLSDVEARLAYHQRRLVQYGCEVQRCPFDLDELMGKITRLTAAAPVTPG
jgi:CheY-like chemotaxis protein